MKSFPMLDTRFAEINVRKTVENNLSTDEITPLTGTNDPKARLSETGIRCATEGELQQLRDEITKAAKKHGYPNPVANKDKIAFDHAATGILVSHIDAPVNDARSVELWNFITAVLLLDVASWRFPNNKKDPKFNRYLGASPKSTFKKLWWIGYNLGDLNSVLGEDMSVALMERTTVAGDPRLPKVIAELAKEREQEVKEVIKNRKGLNLFKDDHTHWFRAALLRITAQCFTVCVESLSDDQLAELVGDCMNAALHRYPGQ
ncbi:MAG: hypothetical protein L0L18_00320 [Acidipropionibacterium jensenii]|nr:hypothetical protein [Acidipropionibacterium jensenii]